MSTVTNELRPASVNAKLIALIASGAVFLGVFLSGFVIAEPAPYDLYMAGLIVVWALFGLRISRAAAPLLVLLVIMNIGGMLGIAGYFHAFPGAEIFTKYDRATGAFQDPNVFGPFLVLPGIYLLYLMLTGPVSRMPLLAVPLLIITAGIFFSFSRGAWGMFGVSAILLTGALFLQSASGKFRLR
ncbi:MAG: hypothetical protein E5Y69_33755, partial [Mesorhizobium sp.]